MRLPARGLVLAASLSVCLGVAPISGCQSGAEGGGVGGGAGEGGLPGLDAGDGPPKPDLPVVTPTAETGPVRGFGDAADDPAIWVHPTDPEKSLIFGTDKTPSGGLFVYGLDGSERAFLDLGELNNVDVRDGFRLGEREVALVVASNRTSDTLSVLALDPETLELEDVAGETIPTLENSYGTCLYKNDEGRFFAFVNSEDGRYVQLELTADGDTVESEVVREFCLETQPEGCVVDDDNERVFVGEEGFGLWVFPAEEDSPSVGDETPACEGAMAGHLIANTFDGVLTRDVEGMGLYDLGDGDGYLIVSAQGDHEHVLFERQPPFAPVLTFAVWGGGEACIDGVEETDGLAVTSLSLGDDYPAGLLAVQDGFNGDPADKQNFKLVSMQDVLDLMDEPDVPFVQNLDCKLGDYGGKPRYAGLPPGPERTQDFCAAFCGKCAACYDEGDPGFSESDCHYKNGKPNFLLDDCLQGCADGMCPADTRPLTPGWEDWDCLDIDEAL